MHVVVAGVEHVFVKEIGVFDCSKCKIFWPRGAAPHGRRGQVSFGKVRVGSDGT